MSATLDGKFFAPVKAAEITSGDCGVFGAPRPHCRLVLQGKAKRLRDHKGIDLRASLLTPIFASADGIVTFAGFQGKNPSRNQSSNSSQATKADIDNIDIAGGGIMVFVAHSPSLETRYMHLASFDVEEGQHVKAGEQIGLSGDSGDAKGGPHLHYEVHRDGKAVDPAPFVFGGQEVA